MIIIIPQWNFLLLEFADGVFSYVLLDTPVPGIETLLYLRPLESTPVLYPLPPRLHPMPLLENVIRRGPKLIRLENLQLIFISPINNF